MTAPTAQAIIKALERQRFQSDMGQLAALDSTHSEAVRTALSAVPGKSKIDVRVLLESVRRNVADRAAKHPPGEAWRYAITLMDDGQLGEFKRLVRDGTDPNEAASRAKQCNRALPAPPSTAIDDAEPDDFDEDGEPEPKRRRSIPRRRLLRAERKPKAKKPEAARVFIGGRLLSPGDPDRPFGQSLDRDSRAASFKPPWLLSDGGEDELPDEEIEDDDVEPRVSA